MKNEGKSGSTDSLPTPMAVESKEAALKDETVPVTLTLQVKVEELTIG